MRGSQIEHVAAGLWHIDIVMTQQVQLVEDGQQTCGVAAAVDAVELANVVHVFHSSARYMIDRAGQRADTPVEPRACCRNSLALRRR